MRRFCCLAGAAAVALGAPTPVAAQKFEAACTALSLAKIAGVGRITEAQHVPAGDFALPLPAPAGAKTPVAEHCLIRGKINERTGIDGKSYAIGYELRVPATWNGKFFFQGGGGMDGVLRPALGMVGQQTPLPNGVSAGYAIVSTDAGHLEEAGPIGPFLFGLDPKARADKGYSSIPPVTEAAKSLIGSLHAKPLSRSYFVGCSNGGRQAMAVTQRFPELFDGVVAAAPAYRVPLAAVDAIGHTQVLMGIAPKGDDGRPDLGSALNQGELKLIADAILDACDAADGVKDGMVQNVKACKFDPAVLACKPGQSSGCLAGEKISVLDRMHKGTRNSKGETIYSDWTYDPGIAAPGWAAWRLGTPKSSPPNARNVTLIPGSIAYAFMVPPEKPADLLDWTLKFDFDRDPAKMAKGDGIFESGMEFETAMSTNVDAFKARGGKILFTHGNADPIFSALDTLRYYSRLLERYESATDKFARVFLVPGMNHCAGGPATDQFDAVAALDAWVETGTAPDMILAKARTAPDVPWPGRTRPLCPYPSVATYKGQGSIEEAGSFACR